MLLIKTLLREHLQKLIVNENFFEKEEKSIDELIECIKDLLVNLKGSIGQSHKLDYFKNRIKAALIEYKNSPTTTKKIISKVNKLNIEFDDDLLKKLKISKLLVKMDKSKDVDKVIDDYLTKLDDIIEDVYSLYKDKLTNDKNYDVALSKDLPNNKDYDISIKKFIRKKYFLQIELMKLQEWVLLNNKKVLILFEGRDAAGKGSNIETFTEFLNPKGFRVETFGIPMDDERENWFKRYNKVLPKEGEIVLFDRSWYNRGVIEPAMGYCTNKQYKDFMSGINDFEKDLKDKKNIIIIKLWLDITKSKQKLRFELRKRDPLKYWKYSENDQKMIFNWDKLTPYIDVMLKDANENPWVVIDSDDKLNGILNSIRSVLTAINYTDKDNTLLLDKNEEDKVIFLDFHGPIITQWYKLPNGRNNCNKGWNKNAINNLNSITDKTGAKIVVISDCKEEVSFGELKNNLINAGVTGEVIGKTIDINKKLRSEQINDYLKNNKVKSFIVIDDKDFDYGNEEKIKSQHIKPQHHKGISKDEVEKAINLLK